MMKWEAFPKTIMPGLDPGIAAGVGAGAGYDWDQTAEIPRRAGNRITKRVPFSLA